MIEDPKPSLLRNTRERYGLVAIALHWVIAAAILGLLVLGVLMVRLPPGSSLQFELYQWHKSVGMTVFALSLLRLGWRLANPPPPLPANLRPWERALARVTHLGFYVLMLALPFSGWMMVSASVWGIPTVLYGVIPLPHLPILSTLENKKPVEDALKVVHEWLAIGMVALLLLHVTGALKHHLVLRDDTLARMLPNRRRRPVGKDHGSPA
jgi:cytochrome b561